MLAALGDRAVDLPILPSPLVVDDADVRARVQDEKRAEWREYAATVAPAVIEAAAPRIKASVAAAMEALNYLEDHPLCETAHEAVHRSAFVKRGLLGCPITLEDDDYWTDCPINLSHLRMGVSAGLIASFECSICGRLVEDCDHRMGEYYLKVAGRGDGGRCTLCDAINCSHGEGKAFMVQASAQSRDVRAQEISLVARPRYPQARIVKMTTDVGDVEREPWVRIAAERGILNCDADLGPCNGFNDMRDWGPLGGTAGSDGR